MKYIVVTGGVLSGLGKGITTSSIGRLLKARGVKLAAVKIDPYVNCDAGTMNPFEHGEVFVLDDGGEVDLDLGNYERFLGEPMTRQSNITTGTVYRNVIEKERRGDYLGKTVQIIPHVTNEIRERVKRVAKDADAQVCLIEVGGTVGDIESMPFLEALRQLRIETGRENMVFIHTTLVPVLGVVGEQKTKPTQTSVKELRSLGIDPEMIVCRSAELLEPKTKAKIALFCDVDERAVIGAPDAKSIYEVPMVLAEQGVDEWLMRRLAIEGREKELNEWRSFVDRIVNPKYFAEIYVVGKYTHLADSYLSITEAFTHAGAELETRVKVRWIDAEEFEKDAAKVSEVLQHAHGILVPGGFGSRATEGKMMAIRYARENEVPFLGICFGFQLATCEFARNVCGLQGANSTEINPDTQHPVIDILPEQRNIAGLGGTMRLGASLVKVTPNTRAHGLYKKTDIHERHRHRYEVNPGYIPKLEAKGLRFVGKDPTGNLMEIVELPWHPFFVGSQFHPEFKSRPMMPAPLFQGFVEAARERMLKSGIHEAAGGFGPQARPAGALRRG